MTEDRPAAPDDYIFRVIQRHDGSYFCYHPEHCHWHVVKLWGGRLLFLPKLSKTPRWQLLASLLLFLTLAFLPELVSFFRG